MGRLGAKLSMNDRQTGITTIMTVMNDTEKEQEIYEKYRDRGREESKHLRWYTYTHGTRLPFSYRDIYLSIHQIIRIIEHSKKGKAHICIGMVFLFVFFFFFSLAKLFSSFLLSLLG